MISVAMTTYNGERYIIQQLESIYNGNIERHNSQQRYMYFYKWAYRVIALIVFILGMVLFPFLNYLVTDPGNVGDIRVYYLIYLFL